MKVNSILETIGNTPHVKINKLFPNNSNVWIKVERQNPGGSLKDRIALAMIEDAEKAGIINKDTTIIEPTSGNTGVGLAMVCAVKGYNLILVMPESMSIERRKLMAAYGAKFILTPKELGTAGAVKKATQLVEETPNSWMPNQFENKSNPNIHATTTAQEILKDFPQGIDYLITGVGTGGHITGIASVLKQKFPNLKVYAVEPKLSAVLSGDKAGPHPLQGIGAGFIPEIVNPELFDGIITIEKEEAYAYTMRIAREEGILAGISTGASLAAVAKILPSINAEAKILTFNYDTGERYWSVDDLFDESQAIIK
ncbi:cysteine synthase A [Myroides guanonis]|uniref:cysteine synthase n=1 Tax=Myroides guanonis TaxID=1150112 RepID=A0A1I3TFR1_9FLAO|nr:cysteine synthase A [Myroides guanonis]SFJ69323.1 cysteine synthase [Myroides guanonis]